MQEEIGKLVEIHFISRNLIVSPHYLIGDRFLRVNDVVECSVDGMLADEVIAGNVVFLADTMGAILALTAVGIRPWELNESDIGGGSESETHPGRLDGADDELSLARLESINGRLLHHHGVSPRDADRFREMLFEFVHNLMQGAEENERFAVGKERLDEVNSLPYLAL